MKKLDYFFLFGLSIVFFQCSYYHKFYASEKKIDKNRREYGNDLSFMFNKRIISNDVQYEKYKNFFAGADTTSITLFFSQTEVTNAQYNVFLEYLKNNYSIDKAEKYRIQNEKWLTARNNDTSNLGKLSTIYHISSEFSNYPVVNITVESAQAYCDWLTKMDPSKDTYYKLPTEEEFLEAFNTKGGDSTFAWGTTSIKNILNYTLANYSEFNQWQIRYNQITDKISFYDSDSIGYEFISYFPKQVYSYNPNLYGMFCVSGNVAEMVLSKKSLTDSTHCITKGGGWGSPLYYLTKGSYEEYKLPSPYVGFRIMKIHLERK